MKLRELAPDSCFKCKVQLFQDDIEILFTGVFVRLHENGKAVIQVFEDADLEIEPIEQQNNNQ